MARNSIRVSAGVVQFRAITAMTYFILIMRPSLARHANLRNFGRLRARARMKGDTTLAITIKRDREHAFARSFLATKGIDLVIFPEGMHFQDFIAEAGICKTAYKDFEAYKLDRRWWGTTHHLSVINGCGMVLGRTERCRGDSSPPPLELPEELVWLDTTSCMMFYSMMRNNIHIVEALMSMLTKKKYKSFFLEVHGNPAMWGGMFFSFFPLIFLFLTILFVLIR